MTEPLSIAPDAAPAPGPAAIAPVDAFFESGLIAAGGAVGALARAMLAMVLPSSPETVAFEIATQVVNGFGAFALGLFLARLERRGPSPRLRPFLAVGVLGSFTTFSTLVDDGRVLADDRSPWIAMGFLALSIAVGMAAFIVGERFDRSFDRAARIRSGATR